MTATRAKRSRRSSAADSTIALDRLSVDAALAETADSADVRVIDGHMYVRVPKQVSEQSATLHQAELSQQASSFPISVSGESVLHWASFVLDRTRSPSALVQICQVRPSDRRGLEQPEATGLLQFRAQGTVRITTDFAEGLKWLAHDGSHCWPERSGQERR
jgi:hypothetical protein